MKIEPSYQPSVANASAKPAQQPRVQIEQNTQEAVTLSALSETLVSTQKPPVDEARIKEIKQAISEGRFKINSESIANSLIESARDLVKYSKNQA